MPTGIAALAGCGSCASARCDGRGSGVPAETRTRLLLLDAGLRRPQTQIVVYDEGGYPFARIDMGWADYRVGVEYDGAQHWTDPKRRGHDIDRSVELADTAGSSSGSARTCCATGRGWWSPG